MRNKWKKRSGEGYIDTCVLILCAMLVIALAAAGVCGEAAA